MPPSFQHTVLQLSPTWLNIVRSLYKTSPNVASQLSITHLNPDSTQIWRREPHTPSTSNCTITWAIMNLSPQSMQSPVSPYSQSSRHREHSSPRNYYSTASQPESAIVRTSQACRLGLICPVPINTPTTVHDLPPSPQPSDNWSHTAQGFTQSSQPPDIFTDDFDVFAPYSAASNTAMISAQSPEAPELVYGHSTPGSNLGSHRGSVSSSYSPSESISETGPTFFFTPPRVKIEEPRGEWYHHPGTEHSPYSLMASPLSAPPEDIRHVPNDWQKPLVASYSIPRMPAYVRGKPRVRRRRTTAEEATHECAICGKLFKRSYNWKSHMETHNPHREYPHPCTAMIGTTPCTKKFQRKTDLDRHYDSVHLKTKNHQCTLCGNRFARRDTLRR